MVAVLPAGNATLTFVITQGVNIMESWFLPISLKEIQSNPDHAWITYNDWLPDDSTIMMPKNERMEARLTKFIIEHTNRCLPK